MRQANGNATIPVEGPVNAEVYLKLAEEKEQGPWHYTFVKDKGYVKFDDAANWSDAKSI
jgi:hypothetical protein